MSKFNQTDPRQADAMSKVILAQNAIDEIVDAGIDFANTLPDLSRHALLDALVGAPFPSALPECEAAQFRAKFLDRLDRHRSTVARFSAMAGI